jgi:hypothetical protein
VKFDFRLNKKLIKGTKNRVNKIGKDKRKSKPDEHNNGIKGYHKRIEYDCHIKVDWL